MNMISELRQRVRQSGKTEITAAEYDKLQTEWIMRSGIDASIQYDATREAYVANLEKQVTLLRDEVTRCRDWFEAQAEVTSKGGPSSWELMLLRDERDTANEALAITRPKP